MVALNSANHGTVGNFTVLVCPLTLQLHLPVALWSHAGLHTASVFVL
jgi:hypothetical protein